MKKFFFGAVGAYLLLSSLLAFRTFRHRERGTPAVPPVRAELRATMHDEDAPREVRPSVSLQVNGAREATVPAGTPVWFTVGVSSPDAANEVAASVGLAARLARLPEGTPERAALAAHERSHASVKITLGDTAHGWAAAVQLVTRDEGGGERPLDLSVKPLGQSTGAVEIGSETSAEANLGTDALLATAGTYVAIACLGDSGSWKGRTCSDSVKVTVTEGAAPATPDQQRTLDRWGARYGFIAGDAQAMERFGRRLVEADAGSVEGHLSIGEAHFQRGHWAEALEEFMAARSTFTALNPASADGPRFLVMRISQAMRKLNGSH